MSRILRRIGLGLVALIALIALAAAIYLPRAARTSFPQTDGTFQAEGLRDEVQVYRDAMGIPHIFAANDHDLFFAQGYVHAQDRFWQMDFQRHASSGRLSEMLGAATLDTDVFLRSMGWQRIAQEELKNLDARTLAALEAYAAGVNAYMEGKSNLELSFEYLFLGLLNGDYEPEPWEPLHTLTWAKAMAWDLRANMGTEIERAVLLQTLSAEQIAELYPPYPAEGPFIVPDFELSAASGAVDAAQADYVPEGDWGQALNVVGQRFAALDAILGGGASAEIGSNSWAVSGELSATGAPLLANDPHLGVGLPSIWYQNSLHCAPLSVDCSLEVSGVSFVGAPGVVIGHNANIAWGFTNTGPDVMDLYIIKVNPENENQYELNGEWVDMEVVMEEISVAGDDDVRLPVRITQFGPIISDSYGPLSDFDEKAGVELPENYAVALRWTALEEAYVISAVLEFDYASNWEEFRAAASRLVVPSQNLLYADVEGNIGYQMPGNIPIRGAGEGLYPAPGWTDEYAWQGYVPFEELPYSFNPAAGFIVTANNAVVSEDYPYRIADSWAYPSRAQRILDMLAAQEGDFTAADFQAQQMDNLSLLAPDLVAALGGLSLEGELLEAYEMLAGWDGQQEIDSAPAALFNVFYNNLLAETFHDELPEDYWPGARDRFWYVFRSILPDAQNAWWDNVSTEALETRDDILEDALSAGLAEIEDLLGGNPENWRWGELHTLSFEHQVMNNFPLINRLFNRGPFETSGGASIVNATSWEPTDGSYAVTALPSKRTVYDLSDWSNSTQIHSMGQSGHAYHPNYVDMTPLWAQGETLPMLWQLEEIQAAAAALMILQP